MLQNTVFLLSSHRARQLYRTVNLRLPGHAVTAAVLRTAIKRTRSAARLRAESIYQFIYPLLLTSGLKLLAYN
jgi:hypothetical protein